MVVKYLDHYVRLNESVRSDIEWWFRLASKWNCPALMTVVDRSNPVALITSDASGSWGCGALYLSHRFQIAWGGPVAKSSITVKELVPIVVAAAIWGRSWVGGIVLARCDNAAVVAMINKGNCKKRNVCICCGVSPLLVQSSILTWSLLMLKAGRMCWLMRFQK